MMLEEIRMPAAGGVEQIGPIEFIAAFRTAWFGQAAKVVVAEGAEDVVFDVRPVGGKGGWRLQHGGII